jgi:putative FmdB family regulatory protein
MPFYEYECPHCGYDEEVRQKITDKPLTKCPSCGKKGLRKLMSAPVFRLKGSGWYETDFKSDKENKRNLAGAEKEEAKAETTTDTKADAKADTKSDAKTDAKPEAAKADTSKKESAKPAAEKASSSARRGASRGKAGQKTPRTAKRLTRR